MEVPLLLYISIAFVVLCIVGRKQAIGGWLLYFYYWVFAVLFISFRDITLHPNVFRPSFRPDAVNRGALVLAVFPRLFVYLAVAAAAVILLVKREWVWVERLRVLLMAGVAIAGFSVWIDVHYFPNLYSPTRCGGLGFVSGWSISLSQSGCTTSFEHTTGIS